MARKWAMGAALGVLLVAGAAGAGEGEKHRNRGMENGNGSMQQMGDGASRSGGMQDGRAQSGQRQGGQMQQGQMQQGQRGQMQGQMQQGQARSPDAMRNVAMINAELESAAANALMLFRISGDEQSYDREYAREFVSNIRDSVDGAQRHVERLQPLAQGGNQQEQEQFRMLRERVNRARELAAGLEQSLGRRQELHFSAGAVHKQLEGSMDPLQQLARDWNVSIDAG